MIYRTYLCNGVKEYIFTHIVKEIKLFHRKLIWAVRILIQAYTTCAIPYYCKTKTNRC